MFKVGQLIRFRRPFQDLNEQFGKMVVIDMPPNCPYSHIMTVDDHARVFFKAERNGSEFDWDFDFAFEVVPRNTKMRRKLIST